MAIVRAIRLSRFLPLTTAILFEILVAPSAFGRVVVVGSPGTPDLASAISAVPALRASVRDQEPIEIVVPAGTTHLQHTLTIDAAHGGTAGSPLIIRGSRDGQTRLTGSRTVMARFARADDAPGMAIPRGALTLPMDSLLGVSNLERRGAYAPTPQASFALFQGSKAFHVARWPDHGWFRGTKLNRSDLAITIPHTVGARWKKEQTLWASGYWASDWAYERVPVAALIDDGTALLLEPLRTKLTPQPQPRFIVQNALSELKHPGEFVIDPTRRLVIFLPIRRNDLQVEVAQVANLIRLNGAKNVELRDLAFDRAAGDAVIVENSTDIRIVKCLVRQAASNGVIVAGGARVVLSEMLVASTGERGVLLLGGDRKRLVPAEHAFVGGVIVDFGLESPSYRPGIELSGVGIRVEGSLISGGDHAAIILSGNNLVVEGNEIAHVLRDTEDAGAIYMGRDWTQRGNIIEGNFIHDIGTTTGSSQFISAIYLDDQFSGTLIKRNVLVGGDFGVVVGGGRDNKIVDNWIINPRRGGIYIDDRGLTSQHSQQSVFLDKLLALPVHVEPWLSRYPELDQLDAAKYGVPEGNVVIETRVFGAKVLVANSAATERFVEVDRNIQMAPSPTADKIALQQLLSRGGSDNTPSLPESPSQRARLDAERQVPAY